MEAVAYTVALSDIVALANRHGRKVTRAWIAKYVRAGLLPPQKKPGLGRAGGKPGNYTCALAKQMIPLIQALKLRGKNLPAVGWDLWWYGWHTNSHYWREPLLSTAKTFDEVRSKLTPTDDEDDGPYELLRSMGEQLASIRSTNPLIGAAKRYGESGVTDLLSLVLGVFTGNYIPLADYAHSDDSHEKIENERLLAKALSLPITDADIPGGDSHFPISIEAMDSKFLEISGQFQVGIENFIRSLPEREIIKARNQICLIMMVVAQIEAQGQKQNHHSAGAKAILWANRSQKQQMAHLIGWLVLRKSPEFSDSADAFEKVLRHQIGFQES
jgi:hypothetical protein